MSRLQQIEPDLTVSEGHLVYCKKSATDTYIGVKTKAVIKGMSTSAIHITIIDDRQQRIEEDLDVHCNKVTLQIRAKTVKVVTKNKFNHVSIENSTINSLFLISPDDIAVDLEKSFVEKIHTEFTGSHKLGSFACSLYDVASKIHSLYASYTPEYDNSSHSSKIIEICVYDAKQSERNRDPCMERVPFSLTDVAVSFLKTNIPLAVRTWNENVPRCEMFVAEYLGDIEFEDIYHP